MAVGYAGETRGRVNVGVWVVDVFVGIFVLLESFFLYHLSARKEWKLDGKRRCKEEESDKVQAWREGAGQHAGGPFREDQPRNQPPLASPSSYNQ
jgi:hypothetical protein